jgi:hypothetical protein
MFKNSLKGEQIVRIRPIIELVLVALVVDGKAKEDPKVRSKYDRAASQLREDLNRRIHQRAGN